MKKKTCFKRGKIDVLPAFLHLVWGQRGGFRRNFPLLLFSVTKHDPIHVGKSHRDLQTAESGAPHRLPPPPAAARPEQTGLSPSGQGLGAVLGAGRRALQGPSVRRS